MKRVLGFVTVLIAVFAVATTTMAASLQPEATQDRSASGPFAIQAEVLQIGNSWLEVKTLAVERGTDLQTNRRLLIFETPNTKLLGTGPGMDLRIGETVEIAGTINESAYQADSISVVQ